LLLPWTTVARDAGALRELELAERRDVRAEALGREQPQDGQVRERLRPVDEQRARHSFAVRAGVRADRRLVVDDDRRAELLGERGRADAAEDELAVLDRGRVGQQVEHRRRLAWSPWRRS
jgi:hypothetical protein